MPVEPRNPRQLQTLRLTIGLGVVALVLLSLAFKESERLCNRATDRELGYATGHCADANDGDARRVHYIISQTQLTASAGAALVAKNSTCSSAISFSTATAT